MNVSLSHFFSEVLKRKLHFIRSWRLQAFAIKEEYIKEPYYPFPSDTGIGFHDDESNLIIIDGVDAPKGLKPILPHYTELTLEKGAFSIVTEDIKTSLGIALINYIAFEPFHPRYPFINKELSPKDITAPFLRDIMAGINDDEYNTLFINVMSDMESLLASDSEFILRSLVEGQFRPDKEHVKLKEKLIKENEGKLDDPLVIAKIQGEIAKSSQKRYKEIGATLWEGGKSHNVTLMKTEGAYGSEATVGGGSSDYVSKSLREGVELDKIGTHIGVARYGSVGRGKLTALGGAAVNDAYQSLESRKSDIEDCKTKNGAERRIRAHNYTMFVGQALAGSKAFLTEEMLKKYIGKTIKIRTPSTCSAKKDSCCNVCGGRYITRIPDSIPTKASGFMSTIMETEMQATHGSSANVEEVDFLDDIF